MSNELTIRRHRVRITVLKKHFHKEFVQKYACNPESWTECRHFEEGQEFLTSREAPWKMPEGFCGWAWADIQKLVYGMARGGQNVFVPYRWVPSGHIQAGEGNGYDRRSLGGGCPAIRQGGR